MTHYTVSTTDVDGSTRRRYKTLDRARARFEAMAGHTIEQAIAEQFHASDPKPHVGAVVYLRAVSMYGTVVTMTTAEAA